MSDRPPRSSNVYISFLHDVGRLADGAHEQVGVLEYGRVDLAEPGALEQRPRLGHDLAAQGRPPGQQVVGAARGLVLRASS